MKRVDNSTLQACQPIAYLNEKIGYNLRVHEYTEQKSKYCSGQMGVMINVIGHSFPLIERIDQIEGSKDKPRNANQSVEVNFLCWKEHNTAKYHSRHSPGCSE